MSNAYVNAVITIRVPLDVSVDAPREEKLRAACEAADRITDVQGAITVNVEDVPDGAPLP